MTPPKNVPLKKQSTSNLISRTNSRDSRRLGTVSISPSTSQTTVTNPRRSRSTLHTAPDNIGMKSFERMEI
jgi:hypothetical protein